MSGPIPQSGRGRNLPPKLPTPPTGWPIGSYDQYAEAQRAVDYLADQDFPVADVTIVGVDLMLVERVIGRLSWAKVLGTGAISGAWFGLLVGLLLSLFSEGDQLPFAPLLVGLLVGVFFGVIFAATSYAFSKRGRDFSSSSQLVAGRYDVLCLPRNAEQGRDLLARLALGPAAGGRPNHRDR